MTGVDEIHHELERIREGASRFAGELRDLGIHVGLGHPARCVTCDVPWPCQHSTDVGHPRLMPGIAATDMPTGMNLLQSWLSRGHAHERLCPACGGDCSNTAIVDLTYRYKTCDCGNPDYPHLVEQLWHLACLAGDAVIPIVDRELLKSALWWMEKYKRAGGSSTASKIRAWLNLHPDGSGPV